MVASRNSDAPIATPFLCVASARGSTPRTATPSSCLLHIPIADRTGTPFSSGVSIAISSKASTAGVASLALISGNPPPIECLGQNETPSVPLSHTVASKKRSPSSQSQASMPLKSPRSSLPFSSPSFYRFSIHSFSSSGFIPKASRTLLIVLKSCISSQRRRCSSRCRSRSIIA